MRKLTKQQAAFGSGIAITPTVDPALNSIEMLEIAELAVPDTPKPAQRSYHSPTPEQETFGFKQRRSARLIPTQKPIEWFDTFDKFMTQETQKRCAKD